MRTVHHILVVEDDVDLGSAVAEQLEAAGGFAVEAVTTLEAAEKAMSAPASDVAAVLLDVRLPDGDGREFCAQMRQTGSNLPVILVSGLDQEDDVVLGLDLGADAYVRKPFSASELVARFRKLLPDDLPTPKE